MATMSRSSMFNSRHSQPPFILTALCDMKQTRGFSTIVLKQEVNWAFSWESNETMEQEDTEIIRLATSSLSKHLNRGRTINLICRAELSTCFNIIALLEQVSPTLIMEEMLSELGLGLGLGLTYTRIRPVLPHPLQPWSREELGLLKSQA